MCQLSQFLWNLAAQLIVTEPKILQGLQASQLARQLSRQASAYEAKIRHQPLAVAPGEFPVTGFGAICFSEAQVTKHADKHLEKSSRRMSDGLGFTEGSLWWKIIMFNRYIQLV